PHLARPINPVVRLVLGLDHLAQLRISQRPRRWRTGLGRVVGARGDLQLLADRLDPELEAVGVDELHYLVDGRSSSAAKKADALRRVAFARGGSRTSRSSSASRSASAVVVPGRMPPSISARWTRPRNVSGLIPSCSPMRRHAPDAEPGSFFASSTSRIARSRSSSGYFLGAAMTLILRGLRASTKPGAVHVEDERDVAKPGPGAHVGEVHGPRAVRRVRGE